MNRISAFIAAVALGGLSTSASAATYIITYEGTVTNSDDVTGVFGGLGSSLNGMAVTAVYTLTAPLAGATTYDNGMQGYIQGGGAVGGPSPVSGTLTINGITQTIEGGHYGYASLLNGLNNGSTADQVLHQTQDWDPDYGIAETYRQNLLNSYIYSFNNEFVGTTDYTQPLTYVVQSGDGSGGNFSFYEYIDFGNVITKKATGTFKPTSITIAAVPVDNTVPEPAAWAMMIMGFSIMGGMMRRQKVRRVRFDFA